MLNKHNTLFNYFRTKKTHTVSVINLYFFCKIAWKKELPSSCEFWWKKVMLLGSYNKFNWHVSSITVLAYYLLINHFTWPHDWLPFNPEQINNQIAWSISEKASLFVWKYVCNEYKKKFSNHYKIMLLLKNAK
jgi:hypothetical protein